MTTATKTESQIVRQFENTKRRAAFLKAASVNSALKDITPIAAAILWLTEQAIVCGQVELKAVRDTARRHGINQRQVSQALRELDQGELLWLLKCKRTGAERVLLLNHERHVLDMVQG